MRNPDTTHKIMSSIPSKNTRPELMLRKALWKVGIRYRVNYKSLPGKPDIVITKWKLVIFCDGDYWHGHNWYIRGLSSFEEELNRYSDYWKSKLLRNIERDDENNKQLSALGWTVIRLWESEIKTNLNECVRTIQDAIFEARYSSVDPDIGI